MRAISGYRAREIAAPDRAIEIAARNPTEIRNFFPPPNRDGPRMAEPRDPTACPSGMGRSNGPPFGGVVMGWASGYIEQLQRGRTVSFRPRGNSMTGKIESGQLCTVEPVDPAILRVGDIVLCKVRGREYLHLVKAIQGSRFQIGNNRGRINGWITASAIYGKCIQVEG
jgi:hypothetical protein